jgi:hypothetical protein
MTSPGKLSDRHNLPVPGDGQDVPSDDQTVARSISDPDDENWGDIIQTLLLDDSYLDGRLVGSGTLSSRPSAGSDAPKLWVVTNGGDSNDQPYLTYNDDSTWHVAADLLTQLTINETDSPYSATAGESVWIHAASGAVEVTLPAPVAGTNVRVVVVDAANTVTVARNGTESIDGTATDLTIDQVRTLVLESDGTNWRTVADTAADVSASDVSGFDEAAQDAVGATVTNGLVYDDGNNETGLDIQTTGTVTLSDGAGTDDTGVAVDRSRYWQVWPSPQAPGDVALSLEDDGATYIVHAEENTTSNNPDVEYALVRL